MLALFLFLLSILTSGQPIDAESLVTPPPAPQHAHIETPAPTEPTDRSAPTSHEWFAVFTVPAEADYVTVRGDGWSEESDVQPGEGIDGQYWQPCPHGEETVHVGWGTDAGGFARVVRRRMSPEMTAGEKDRHVALWGGGACRADYRSDVGVSHQVWPTTCFVAATPALI